jgi:polyhydroxyalkanoate synthesis regulator phasin
MVMDALRGYLQLAGGMTEMSRQRATAMAKAMLASPEATRDQVSSLANDLLETSKANREAVSALVKYEVDRGLGRLGFATAEELAQLSGRVRSLESEVRELRQAQATAAAAPPAAPAVKAPARKAPARKPAVGTSAGTGTTRARAKRSAAKPATGGNPT